MKKRTRKMDSTMQDICIVSALVIFCMAALLFLLALARSAIGTTGTEELSTTVSTEIKGKLSRTPLLSEEPVDHSDELSEESSVEEPIEPSDELPEESSVKELDEISAESADELYLTDDEFRLLCYVAYAEAGSETPECLIGTIWNMKNGAEKKNGGDFISYLTYPERYSVFQEDGTVLSGDGIVNDSMISEEFKELVRKILSGEIPDPTKGYECYVAYERITRDQEFTDPDEFAEFYDITDYVVLGKHIFFPEEQWPAVWN